MSWDYLKAEDYCDSVRDGTHDTPKPVESGYKLVTGKHIKNGTIDYSDAYFISEKDYVAINQRSLVEKWDVLMSMIGTVGEVAVVKEKPNYAIKNVALFKCGGSELKGKWLKYYLSSPNAQGKMRGGIKGSSQQFLSLKQLRELSIPVTTEHCMKKIVDILSDYDNLIENNQKQIKLLEEAAQRLYKEWFVDLRFPGYESATITDGVPEGWIKKNLSDVAILKAGGDRPKNFSRYKTDKYNVPVYSNGAENEGLYGYTNQTTIEEQCITVSARGNVGYTCLRRKPFVPIVRLITIIPKTINVEYLYFYLKYMKFESNGVAQQQITVPMIKDKVVLIPHEKLLNAFTESLLPMLEQIDNMKDRIEKITEARDRLLPKLMSGEIEV